MGKVETSSIQVGLGRTAEAIERDLTTLHEGIASREGSILAKYVLNCTIETNAGGVLESDDPAATQDQERLFVVSYIPDETEAAISEMHWLLEG